MTSLRRIESHEELSQAGIFLRDSCENSDDEIPRSKSPTNEILKLRIKVYNQKYFITLYVLLVAQIIVLLTVFIAAVNIDWETIIGLDTANTRLSQLHEDFGAFTQLIPHITQQLDNVTESLPMLKKCSVLLDKFL